MSGLFLLREGVSLMVAFWNDNQVITEFPLINMIFKLNNTFKDSRGVAFLHHDSVGLNTPFDNRFDHPYLPRPRDINKFLAQCCGMNNAQIRISCNLAAFLLQITTIDMGVTWDREFI